MPSDAFWSPSQWAALHALTSAVYAPITTQARLDTLPITTYPPPEKVIVSQREWNDAHARVRASKNGPTPEDVDAFLDHDPAAAPAFREELVRLASTFPDRQRRVLGFFLWLLSTRLGSFIFTGSFRPLDTLPLAARADVIRYWNSPARPHALRVLGKAFADIAKWIVTRTDPVLLRSLRYPEPPPPPHPLAPPRHPFEFTEFPLPHIKHDTQSVTIKTDVVIVGSGCGGAVVAKTLAAAGLQVHVVDKGRAYAPPDFPMSQADGPAKLFENGGYVGADGLAINLVAGSTWGGGGTVNWGVALRTQDKVLREWAERDALPFFTSDEYQSHMDNVCEVMGVSADGVRHNFRNQMLLDGCERLGWRAGTTPLNAAGKDHYCGQCHLGCPTNGKKGPAVSWLPAAADAGALFIEGYDIEKVVVDGDKVARGVVGTWTPRDAKDVDGEVYPGYQWRVEIHARRVILSAGALWSPIILKNSGISNPLIGKNLHLHPCNMVVGLFDKDLAPWEGSPITVCCDEFDDLDGEGYGVKLESLCMVPYSVLNFIPSSTPLSTKLAALQYRSMAAFISLARDRDPGTVFADPRSKRPRVEWAPSVRDRAHVMEGVVALAKICYLAGAVEVRVLHAGVEPFVRGPEDETDKPVPTMKTPTNSSTTTTTTTTDTSTAASTPKSPHDPELTNPRFASWLTSVRRADNLPPDAAWASAHQMGTCRMTGRGEEAGVVDSRGRVFGVRNLVVADASVLPGASGVNPMVTVMAVAEYIARGVVEELAREGGEG